MNSNILYQILNKISPEIWAIDTPPYHVVYFNQNNRKLYSNTTILKQDGIKLMRTLMSQLLYKIKSMQHYIFLNTESFLLTYCKDTIKHGISHSWCYMRNLNEEEEIVMNNILEHKFSEFIDKLVKQPDIIANKGMTFSCLHELGSNSILKTLEIHVYKECINN